MGMPLRQVVRFSARLFGLVLITLACSATALAATGYRYTKGTGFGGVEGNRQAICFFDTEANSLGDRDKCVTWWSYQSPTTYDFTNSHPIKGGTIHVDGTDPTKGVLTKRDGKTEAITIQHADIFRAWFPNAAGPPPAPQNEAADTKVVLARITATYSGIDGDKELSPDKVTLKDASGSQVLATIDAVPNPDKWVSNVIVYEGRFENVAPGSYQVCSQILNKCTAVTKTAGQVPTAQINGNVSGDPPLIANNSLDEFDIQCSETGGALSWLLCPTIRVMNGAITILVDKVVEPALHLRPLDNTQASETLRRVWGAMRNLANIAFVLAFLGVVFSNTLSINIDNYTIKKMLPRLMAAAILVQFSYLICGLIVDIGNVLGQGIFSLIAGSFTAPGAAPGAGDFGGGGRIIASSFVVGVAGTAAVYFAAPTVVGIAIGLLVGIISTVITLAVRVIIIDMAIILSPLAFAAWILPNTESFFKKWIKSFVGIVMMYPFIMIILAVGHLVSKTAEGGDDGIGGFIRLLAPMITFFMIPATFKMAGSFLGAAGNLVSGRLDKLKGGLYDDKLKKDWQQGRQERRAQKAFQELPEDAGRLRTARAKTSRWLAGASVKGLSAVSPRAGARKLDSAFDQALEKQGEDFKREAVRRNLSASQLADIAGTRDGDKKHGVRVNQAARAAAIDMLGEKRDISGLRAAKEAMGEQNGRTLTTNQNRIWEYGVRKHAGAVNEMAPDLIQGQGAFKSVTAAGMSKWHGSTAEKAVQYMGSDPVAPNRTQFTAGPEGDAAFQSAVDEHATTIKEREVARDRFATAVQQVSESQTLRSQIKPEVGKTLENSSLVFAGRKVNTKSGPVDADKFVENVVQDDGTIREYDPGAATGSGNPAGGGGGGAPFVVSPGGTVTPPTGGNAVATVAGTTSGAPSATAPPAATSTNTPSSPATGALGTLPASTPNRIDVIGFRQRLNSAASVADIKTVAEQVATNPIPGQADYEATVTDVKKAYAAKYLDTRTPEDERLAARDALKAMDDKQYYVDVLKARYRDGSVTDDSQKEMIARQAAEALAGSTPGPVYTRAVRESFDGGGNPPNPSAYQSIDDEYRQNSVYQAIVDRQLGHGMIDDPEPYIKLRQAAEKTPTLKFTLERLIQDGAIKSRADLPDPKHFQEVVQKRYASAADEDAEFKRYFIRFTEGEGTQDWRDSFYRYLIQERKTMPAFEKSRPAVDPPSPPKQRSQSAERHREKHVDNLVDHFADPHISAAERQDILRQFESPAEARQALQSLANRPNTSPEDKARLEKFIAELHD